MIAYGNRGWIAGNYLQYNYQNQRMLEPAYGARVGIPIISFVIGACRGNDDYDRPSYRNRNSWSKRPMLHRPPPRPGQRPPHDRPLTGAPSGNRAQRPSGSPPARRAPGA